MREAALRKILDPVPGTALARARDYGIDLTLLARNVGWSPEARLDGAVRAQAMARALREIRKDTGRP